MFGYTTLLFSLSDFATSIHLSRSQATDIVGFLNLGTAVGRPLIGILSDRFSRTNTAAVLTLVCGLICFALWLPATSFGLTVFFALICGAILGVFWMFSISSSLLCFIHNYGPFTNLISSADHRSSVCRSSRPQKPPFVTVPLLGHNHSPYSL